MQLQITLLRRDELLKADADILHSLITHVPRTLDVEQTVARASELEARYPALALQKRSGLWLHDSSPVNRYEEDWSHLRWGDVPDRLRADAYLGEHVTKEEWEDDMLAIWAAERDNILHRM